MATLLVGDIFRLATKANGQADDVIKSLVSFLGGAFCFLIFIGFCLALSTKVGGYPSLKKASLIYFSSCKRNSRLDIFRAGRTDLMTMTLAIFVRSLLADG